MNLVTERAAFEQLMLTLTGRDMDYHARARTTDIETSWSCYLAGVAAEREQWADVVSHAVQELEGLDEETAQAQAASLRWLLARQNV